LNSIECARGTFKRFADLFPRSGSLLKSARESVALFYRLVLLSLLLRLFFDARGVGTSVLEEENNSEEK
jgi:predicted ABC-type exoprotein transport system permease subunit